ncbi:hypothetical protein NLO88_13910 [Pseudomonas syringae]|nr:hypothetical protein [Pseudomonas syringae]MCQ3031755.1 hypothetical protein [Pseudomonas syringae]
MDRDGLFLVLFLGTFPHLKHVCLVSFDYIARAEPMPIEKRTKVLLAAFLAVDRGFFSENVTVDRLVS